MKRIVLAILLAVIMTVSLLTVGAAAVEDVSYIDENGTTQTCTSATNVEGTSTSWGSAGQTTWYVVNSSVTIADRITVTGNVNLILADGKTLTAQKGIYVGSGNSLTIYGQSGGTGELTAKAFQVGSCAGIGGNTDNEAAHGNITINGGIIEATSNGGGAGIGSGSGSGSSDKPNGTITINGGSVTATTNVSNGAGIGGGYNNNIAGGDIVINRGTVEANGAVKAAGIGTGYSDQQPNGRSITISGGTVIANGGTDAAGIGGGYGCKGKSVRSITINGSANVTANGGERGAGIGSGFSTSMTTSISISGDATVKANGGAYDSYGGAGIGTGGGTNSTIGDITINGGNVTATGGTSDDYSGAGIGSGGYSKLRDENYKPIPATGKIIINAGTITATGGTGAAGIGDGKYGAGGDFSTGENGQAVIYASSISDNDADGWNGIVFQGDEGQVYGDVTLSDDLSLAAGQTMTVPADSSLTVPEGKKLTVTGALTNNGLLSVAGTMDNKGTIQNAGQTVITGTITGNEIKGTPTVNNPEATYTGANDVTTYYETVGEAISASNSGGGGTVTLLQDTSFSANLNLANQITLTIDLGTHTLTSTSEGGITIGYNGVETEGCNLTIKNGTYENTHAEGTAIWGFAEGSITIAEDAIIKAVDTCICTGGNYDTSGRTVINVYGKLYCEGTAVWCQGPDNEINIYGAEIEAGEYAVFHTYKYGGSEISIKDSKLTGDEYAVYLGNTIDSSYGKHKLTVENSQLKSNKFGICVEHSDVDIKGENTLIDVPDGYALAVIYNNSNLEGTTGTLNIEGGTLNGLIAELDPSPGTENKAVLTVSGGKFDTNVDGKYVAANLKYGAWDGEYFTYHETREDAIEAAAPNGYIFVVTGPGHITYTVTIVYGNGSANDSWLVVDNEKINLPTAPSKPGYIFLGWRNGNVTYGAGDPVVVTSDMTFYAVWANMPDVTPGTPGGGDDEPVVTFPFNDVSVLDWFYDSVYYVWENELMNGTDVNQFSPNSPLTRAMVWAVLARVDGETISGDSWMTEAQAWAVESGVSDGTDPTGYITREQLVTMLYRFAGEPAGAADISGYPDAASISDWAADAMAWAVKVGLIEGDDVGALNPTANSTRAHAATFFMRFSKTIL